MSQLEVDKIIPQSGTTLTIGETGDTISFASGVLPSLESLTITGDLTVDTDTLYVDSTNNRVGIGTSSPSTNLQVSQNSTIAIDVSDAQFPFIGAIGSSDDDLVVGSWGDVIINADFNNSSGQNIIFKEGTSEHMRIDSSGNVGIGTSSPSQKLDVVGSIKSSQSITIGSNGLYEAGSIYSDSNWGMIFRAKQASPAVADFRWANSADTERMRIDSSGNVGIGTSSPAAKLDVNGGLNCGFLQSTSSIYATSGIFRSSDGSAATPSIQPGVDADTGFFRPATNTIGFSTAGSERMRILSGGQVKIGTPIPSSDTPGLGNNDQGVCFRGNDIEQFFINSNNAPAFIGRTVDGTIVAFQSAGTQEGTISISGTTTSYNGFTGTHWSRLIDNSKPTILKGTILESLDEMMDWYQVQFDITETDDEGNETTRTQKQSYALGDGESVGDVITYNYEGADYQATIVQEGDVKHTKAKISDTVDAKNVYGVFMAWDNDDDTVNDMYVAQTGSYIIRINGSETVSKGDLIQSNGDGTGKVQSDDIIRASTVAKVISSTKVETYDDGSYTVPCTLHC